MLALATVLIAALFLTAAFAAYFIFTTVPAYASCVLDVCGVATMLAAVLTTWLAFLPLMIVGLVLVSVGYDRLLQRATASSDLVAAPDGAPRTRFDDVSREVQQLRQDLDRERSARELAEARAEVALSHDALTGLVNSTRLRQLIASAIERGAQSQQSLALFFLDIDDFKQVNDTYGHLAADQFLRLIGDRLRRALDCDECIARMGGDEFLVLVEEIGDRAHAEVIAQGLLAELTKPCVIDGQDVSVTASVGVSMYPHDGEDGFTLMRCADHAMYRAKDAGKNTYRFHQ